MDEKVSEWFEEHGWRNFGGWEAAAHQAAQDYAAHVADPLAEALKYISSLQQVEWPAGDNYRDGQMRAYSDCGRVADAALAAYNRMK